MNDAQKSIIDCKSGVSEMLRRLIQSVCGIILGITVAAQNLAAQQSASKCLPADAQSASFINELQRMMAATDSWTIQGRDNVFHVPVVSPSQVTLVTDAKTCDKASVAFGPPPGSTVLPTVYVIKLGNSGYAVKDPNHHAGHFDVVMIFDRRWNRIGGWTG